MHFISSMNIYRYIYNYLIILHTYYYVLNVILNLRECWGHYGHKILFFNAQM